jgi:hypothetical protein
MNEVPAHRLLEDAKLARHQPFDSRGEEHREGLRKDRS